MQIDTNANANMHAHVRMPKYNHVKQKAARLENYGKSNKNCEFHNSEANPNLFHFLKNAYVMKLICGSTFKRK